MVIGMGFFVCVDVVKPSPRPPPQDAVFGVGKAEAVDPDVIGEETEL